MQVSREVLDKIKADAAAVLPEGTSLYTDIADNLGISRQAVHMWFKKGVIPVEQVVELESYLIRAGSHYRRDDIFPTLYHGMMWKGDS